MGTLNVSQVAQNPIHVGDVSLSLLTDLPAKFNLNVLKRSNRVNIRLREEDISTLEAMALDADMPFQAFLAEIVHQFAKGNLQEK
jgi:predicted DNA binding CopG/RHH family protein